MFNYAGLITFRSSEIARQEKSATGTADYGNVPDVLLYFGHA